MQGEAAQFRGDSARQLVVGEGQVPQLSDLAQFGRDSTRQIVVV